MFNFKKKIPIVDTNDPLERENKARDGLVVGDLMIGELWKSFDR